MPCRRPHRKSRLGCKVCKSRRTKCDEVHPTCSNCKKHGVVCDFEISRRPSPGTKLPPIKIPPLQKKSQDDALMEQNSPSSWSTPTVPHGMSCFPAPSVTISQVSSPTSSYLVLQRMDTPPDRLLEMRLLHHYIMMTTPTFQARQTGDILITASGGNVYANWMLRLALETPSIMDAVLGFSAFHLYHINKADKQASFASLTFMTRAISKHAENLRCGITPDNAEICFAASTLIAFHSSTAQCLIQEEESNRAPVLPLRWFTHWQGIRAVLDEGLKYIKTQEIKDVLLAEGNLTKTLLLSSDIPTPHTYSFLVADLDRNNTDEETQFAYDSAVAWLAKAQSSLIMRNVFKFTAVVTKRFIQLLEQRDPRALCICAYFFVLMKKLVTIWWLDGVAGPEFWGLMSFIPEQWKTLMEWGVKEIENSAPPAQSAKPESNWLLVP
ncbi:hypothetical protein N431DRAFT_449023 [Stipitochalara longipes BDJ]|nr:hypothetical protein N431DRAFT_449023 [Stipitochalara longipes BDJ]